MGKVCVTLEDVRELDICVSFSCRDGPSVVIKKAQGPLTAPRQTLGGGLWPTKLPPICDVFTASWLVLTQWNSPLGGEGGGGGDYDMAARIWKGRDIVKEIQQGLVIDLMRNMEVGEKGGVFCCCFSIWKGILPHTCWLPPREQFRVGSKRELRGRVFFVLTLGISAWFDFTSNNKNILTSMLKRKIF